MVFNGGLGDDKVDASATTGITINFDGGVGNDTLITGTGGATFSGGDGNDTVDGSRASADRSREPPRTEMS